MNTFYRVLCLWACISFFSLSEFLVLCLVASFLETRL